MSDDWSGRDRALRGAEGECRSSQAKGSGDDDTPKSAAAAARRRCNLPETAGNLSGNGRRHEAKGPCVSDCQKTCQAKSFGGKKSVKGNRQGVLSRLITRRSGRIAKYYYKILFCNSECSLAKSPEGTFDKLRHEAMGLCVFFHIRRPQNAAKS